MRAFVIFKEFLLFLFKPNIPEKCRKQKSKLSSLTNEHNQIQDT